MKKIIFSFVLILFTVRCFAFEASRSNFVIVESAMPHNLNPHETSYSSDAQILDGLYEGLFTYNPVSLDPQYAIACDYKLSRDKKRWTFILRDNAFFSNGDPITAESVRFSWLELLKNQNAPYSSLLDIVRHAKDFRNGQCSESEVGIYAVDDHTLSVSLNSPANYLPKILCHNAFSVVHPNPTVYSGAYILDDIKNGELILKKNKNYWDAANTKMEQITFVQSNNPVENTFYFNTGAADWISGEVDVETILNTKNIQYSAQFGTSYFFFKMSSKKPNAKGKFNAWDYEEFRCALLEAWPWEKLNRSLIPATTFVYPLSGYPTVEGFAFSDIMEAKRLFAEARKKYGIPEDQIIELNFEISEYGLLEDSRKIIFDTLEPLGIHVNYIVWPTYQYLQHVPSSSSDLFGYTWIGDFADPLAFLELFTSESTLNDSGWHNEQYDNLLKQAELVSAEERYKILAQAETLLLDSGMVIPYYHPVSSNLIDLNYVGGWAANAFDIHPLKYLFKKEVQIKAPNLVIR